MPDISLLGATYSDVPGVTLPKSGGGTAYFVDTSNDTVTAETLDLGVTAHDASGAPITGTRSSPTVETFEFPLSVSTSNNALVLSTTVTPAQFAAAVDAEKELVLTISSMGYSGKMWYVANPEWQSGDADYLKYDPKFPFISLFGDKEYYIIYASNITSDSTAYNIVYYQIYSENGDAAREVEELNTLLNWAYGKTLSNIVFSGDSA